LAQVGPHRDLQNRRAGKKIGRVEKPRGGTGSTSDFAVCSADRLGHARATADFPDTAKYPDVRKRYGLIPQSFAARTSKPGPFLISAPLREIERLPTIGVAGRH